MIKILQFKNKCRMTVDILLVYGYIWMHIRNTPWGSSTSKDVDRTNSEWDYNEFPIILNEHISLPKAPNNWIYFTLDSQLLNSIQSWSALVTQQQCNAYVKFVEISDFDKTRVGQWHKLLGKKFPSSSNRSSRTYDLPHTGRTLDHWVTGDSWELRPYK